MGQTENKIIGEILPYLPEEIMKSLIKKDEAFWNKLREIRITVGKPVIIDVSGKPELLKNNLSENIKADCACMKKVTDAATHGSMYSVNETIKRGYVTICGGHRIGFCGTAVSDNGGVRHIKDISSVCIRISREVKGCASSLKKELLGKNGICNVLIASPPGFGKTTILRDICRILADGELPCGMLKVGIADERSEIAATYLSVPQHSIGSGAFVCDGYKKSDAMQMMLRSMSPNVLITDEIGGEDDFCAVKSALKSGVSVIASAHADSIEDLCFKYGKELINSCFEKVIFLKDKGVTDKIYRRLNDDY